MLYAELKVKTMAVVVVETVENAYSLSYIVAKNTAAVQKLPKEVLLSALQMWIRRKN